MRLHRFYVSQPLGEEVVIDDVSTLFQWSKVFRYTQDDAVILFNGDGYDSQYSITEITKKTCSLVRTEQHASYIPSQQITLCLSLIKKDNFELAVQKATELGVTSILPILSSRSEKKNLSMERLHKIIVEASEQCGRGDIPTISDVTPLDTALLSISHQQVPILLMQGGKPLIVEQVNLRTKNKEIFLFIGPEGGWSDEDLTLFEKYSLEKYSLGKTVLRAETAAICALSLLTA